MISRGTINKDWPHVELGEVVEFLDHLRKPVTAKDRVAGPYPYYGANGQQDSVDDYIFDEPLILLAEDGGHFGEPEKTIAYQVEGKCWVNNHAHVLRPSDRIEIRFLCRHLENYDVRPYTSGTTRLKLNKGKAAKIKLALPPLEEQKRIAELLDRAEALRTRRRAALGLLEELTQSIFLDMFGDPVVNPRGLDKKKIGEIATVITGNTPSRKQPEYYGDHIEWIKSDNINGAPYFATTAEEFLSESGLAVGRSAPSDSILITCIAGSPSCIGNAAMIDREVAFNQQINALVDPRANPHFLFTQLVVGKRLIQRVSSNGMKGIVSKRRLESVELVVPLQSEQEEFAARSASIEALKQQNSAALEKLDELFASLQSRAFKGELFGCSREPVAAD